MSKKGEEKDKKPFFGNKIVMILLIIFLLSGIYFLYNYYEPAFSDRNEQVEKSIQNQEKNIQKQKNKKEKDINKNEAESYQGENQDQKRIEEKEKTKKIEKAQKEGKENLFSDSNSIKKEEIEKDDPNNLSFNFKESNINSNDSIINENKVAPDNIESYNVDSEEEDSFEKYLVQEKDKEARKKSENLSSPQSINVKDKEGNTKNEKSSSAESNKKDESEINSFEFFFENKISEPFTNFSGELEKEFNKIFDSSISIEDSLKPIEIVITGLDNASGNNRSQIDSLIIAEFIPKNNKINIYAVNTGIKIKNQKLKTINPNHISDKISSIYGKKPEYYLQIGYDGFKKVINEVGGIKLNLEESLQVKELDLNLSQGENNLSGKEALNYCRWYDPELGEKERIKRQIKVVSSLKNKLMNPEVLLDLPGLYTTLVESYKMVETNIDVKVIYKGLHYIKNRNNIKLEYFILQ